MGNIRSSVLKYAVDSANTTNAASIKATGGNVYSVTAHNNGAATVAYVKIYDKASAPTVGTDVPVLIVQVNQNTSTSNGMTHVSFGTFGLNFTNGIAIAITGLATNADATAVAANAVKVAVAYA